MSKTAQARVVCTNITQFLILYYSALSDGVTECLRVHNFNMQNMQKDNFLKNHYIAYVEFTEFKMTHSMLEKLVRQITHYIVIFIYV